MIRFFSPDIASSLALPESDSGHCVRVLRMRPGDPLEVVDGRGNLFRCTLLDANPRRALVEITETVTLPKVWQGSITLAIAPTKHADRMEWLVEKLVEIGIDRIVPLRCRHSERKDINVARLEKIAVSAMKQSLKATLPVIDPITPFNNFIDSRAALASSRFIAYCDPSIERRLFAREYLPGSDADILIGPEGDFAPEEIHRALDAGWIPVSLGDNRLRTETAALYAVAACHIISQASLPLTSKA